jgi:plastocyanin
MKAPYPAALCLGALVLCAAGAATIPLGNGRINIDNFTFGPAMLTVAAGSKVTWTNRDDIPHTVVDAADQRQFKSSPLDTGDSFSYVFGKPGTYRFFCSIHPRMQGTVVVR